MEDLVREIEARIARKHEETRTEFVWMNTPGRIMEPRAGGAGAEER